MADTPKTNDANNPELSLNPNTAAGNASSEVSSETTNIQNDLDDLISSSINDSAVKQKIDFTASKSDQTQKDDKKKQLLRQRKIPTYIIVFGVLCI